MSAAMATLNRKQDATPGWITDLICFLVLGAGIALWVDAALRQQEAQSPGITAPDAHGTGEKAYDVQPPHI